ncbi:sulfite exporter TauE/SafE family protein [Cocleimonas sp. KMM 6892]|uniref:sulfite exporter TauE/SafE family protein n=1 Tax=unclassified Cocleimonas TaxID=2639732 RepID=UPI002DB7B5C1|nr:MULTISPECIES: sulfite exporter TauE/SafE family protein [unclassified Cocleimonas]MEB8430650.1 sulfite exporter TauE/SafE family protein [Cocleimonas sp. KMM 6892]MEC4716899.1 sulfite exporter TauE/SafE family protein [Cocleimonas sp. KMM 6895]MEC4743911.1 sulfite exporter TauE/SafE family protein [Cocleimonas sp. KMM 6896]
MLIAFVVGLLSTIHCIGMCGGLVGAMTMSLSPEIRQNQLKLAQYTFAYNLGRIISYMIAGLLVGLLGQVFKDFIMPEHGIGLLRLIASFMIIAMGFYIAGLFPQFSRIEKIGVPIWSLLQPLGQKLLPVDKIWKATMFGLVWGWLPCGLVYYMLLMSPASDGAINSALFMMVFGIGTLIPMMSTGFLTGKITQFRNSKKIQSISGLLLIIMGIISLILVVYPHLHHQLHFQLL